jgi:tRNA 2-thiouridine synthesizing protein D
MLGDFALLLVVLLPRVPQNGSVQAQWRPVVFERAGNLVRFTIAVHGAPYASSASQTALNFARAVLESEHEITQVFFFHEGVSAALGSAIAPQEEEDVVASWQTLAQSTQTQLAVCIANGLKRGILDLAERDRYAKDCATLADGFELVGLGQLIDAIASSDRYVEFPA